MDTLIKEKKPIFIYSLIIFGAISLVYFAIYTIMQVNTNNIKKIEVLKNENRIVEVEKYTITNKINDLTADLLYLSDELVDSNFNDKLDELESKWLNFSNRKMVYDQIRFIDVNGNEVIRINNSNGEPDLVSYDKLQNKSDRYYFKESIALDKGQIYISKMDLNIENDEIEEPIKPIIRLSTPVFDSNNNLLGVVILNYLAENLIDDFKNIASTSVGYMFLLNSDSYYLYSDMDSSKEWSFMYDNEDVNFQNDFDEAWSLINSNIKDVVTDKGYFIYSNINAGDKTLNETIILDENKWLVVSYIPTENNAFYTSFSELVINNLISCKYVFLLIFIISIIFAILFRLYKISQEKIKFYSEYDTMTGTYNRRAGIELLKKEYLNSIKTNRKCSICFIDINGLKEVNDTLGHEMGDELIISAINLIKANISKNDFVIRLGGDEFLIVFLDRDIEETEKVWNMILDMYTNINENENRSYVISVSHGIAEYTFKNNEDIEEIINLADEKMYIEKRNIKNNLKIIKCI